MVLTDKCGRQALLVNVSATALNFSRHFRFSAVYVCIQNTYGNDEAVENSFTCLRDASVIFTLLEKRCGKHQLMECGSWPYLIPLVGIKFYRKTVFLKVGK